MVVFFGVLLLPAVGCFAVLKPHGLKNADHDYAPESRAKYSIEKCSNSTVDALAKTYHVVQVGGQSAVFERRPDGTGVLFTDHWADPGGDHYFGWLYPHPNDQFATGWEVLISQSGGGTVTVYEFLAVTAGSDGVYRPTSKPTDTCSLSAAVSK
jgi:hypothetical protein